MKTLMESQTTEFKRIWKDECLKAGLPKPEYRYSFGAVQVTFHKKEATPMTTPMSTPMSTKDKLISILKHNPKITREELAIELDISINGIKQHILKLKKDGILHRIGDNRNGYWKIIIHEKGD